MKKFLSVFVIVFVVAALLVFGAWSPVVSEEQPAETRYTDAQTIATLADEKIYYTSREISERNTDGGAPNYTNSTGMLNGCGAVAGAEVVGFYDKYYPELIPDWDSTYSNGKYRIQESTYVKQVLEQMYDLMHINVGGDGVTEADFKSGLQTYFTNHGRTLSYRKVGDKNSLDYNACVDAINNNKIIVLLTLTGNIYDIGEHDGYNTIIEINVTSNHIMTANGYLQIKYYNETGWFRTETFLRVSSGFIGCQTAYYKLNSTNLESAYICEAA